MRLLFASITVAMSAPLAARETVDVTRHGAVGQGCPHDDAPALRLILDAAKSGQTIMLPKGRVFCLASTVPALDYPATDAAALVLARKKDVVVDARGARLEISPAIAYSTAVLIAEGRDIEWRGGYIVGTRTGLRTDQENVAITLLNLVDFKVSNVTFSGFDRQGAAVAGDWLVRGRLSGLRMIGVGLCFDFAFLRQIVIRDVVAVGGDGGQTCFSNSVDHPLAAYNRTGIPFDDSSDALIERLNASRFNTGVALSSGSGWRFVNVKLHNNYGREGVLALGYFLRRPEHGPFRAGATRLRDVTISGGSVMGVDRAILIERARKAVLMIDGLCVASGQAGAVEVREADGAKVMMRHVTSGQGRHISDCALVSTTKRLKPFAVRR